jgi:hypothetical protein
VIVGSKTLTKIQEGISSDEDTPFYMATLGREVLWLGEKLFEASLGLYDPTQASEKSRS